MRIPKDYRWLLHFCCFYKGQDNIDHDQVRKIEAIEREENPYLADNRDFEDYLRKIILPSLRLFLSFEKQWVQNIIEHGENIMLTHEFIRLNKKKLCNRRILERNAPMGLLALVSEKFHQVGPEFCPDNFDRYLHYREKLFSCKSSILLLDYLRLERLMWYSYHELVVNGNPDQIEWYDDIVPERFQTPSSEDEEHFETVESVDGFPFLWTEYSGNRYRLKKMTQSSMASMLFHAFKHRIHVNWVEDPDTLWGPIGDLTLHPEYTEVRHELVSRIVHYNDCMAYYVGRYQPVPHYNLYVYRKELNSNGTPLMVPETYILDYRTGVIQTPDQLGLNEDELLAKVKDKL